MDHLLEGRRRRRRPAAGLVEQPLDRGAVDGAETDEIAAAVAAQPERRRVALSVNVGVRALLVDLLILPTVEINLAWGQQSPVPVVAPAEDYYAAAIAVAVVEQMAFLVSTLLSYQHPTSGSTTISKIVDQKYKCVSTVSAQMGSSERCLREQLFDLESWRVLDVMLVKELLQASRFTECDPLVQFHLLCSGRS